MKKPSRKWNADWNLVQTKQYPASMSLIYFVRRYSVMFAVLGFLFLTLPPAVSGTWALFSNEPLVPWLSRHHLPVISFSPSLITVPVGLLLFALVIAIQLRMPFLSKRQQKAIQERHAAALRDEPEAPDIATLRFKLNTLLEKRARLASMPESHDHDIPAAIRRNEQAIREVEAEIKRFGGRF